MLVLTSIWAAFSEPWSFTLMHKTNNSNKVTLFKQTKAIFDKIKINKNFYKIFNKIKNQVLHSRTKSKYHSPFQSKLPAKTNIQSPLRCPGPLA